MNAQAQQQDPNSPEYQALVVNGFTIENEKYKAKRQSYLDSKKTYEDALNNKVTDQRTKILAREGIKTANEGIALFKDYIAEVEANPKQWDKEDLNRLATHKYGYVAFEAIMKLYNMGHEQVGGKFTEKASAAQKILLGYMPELPGQTPTQSLQVFMGNIRDVAISSKATRDALRTQSVTPQKAGIGTGAVFDLPKGVEYAPEKDERLGLIDQQKALQVLEANKVGVDASQKLEVPAGLKDAITTLQSRAA